MIRRSRKLESAYNSALNKVCYDVEHKFSPVDLKNGYYIGIDDVQYYLNNAGDRILNTII